MDSQVRASEIKQKRRLRSSLKGGNVSKAERGSTFLFCLTIYRHVTFFVCRYSVWPTELQVKHFCVSLGHDSTRAAIVILLLIVWLDVRQKTYFTF